jgi:hypothetical protein
MVFLYLMLQIVFFVKHRFNRVNLFQKVTTLLLCPQVKIVSTSGFASQMNSNICETLSESAGCGAACLSASGSNSTQTLQSILEGLDTSQARHSFSHHPSCKFIVQLFQTRGCHYSEGGFKSHLGRFLCRNKHQSSLSLRGRGKACCCGPQKNKVMSLSI